MSFPNKKYQIIYADPPWKYNTKHGTQSIGKNGEDTLNPEYYYPVMELEEIKSLPIKNIIDKNAVLYLWATNPLLQEGLDVMKAWGFKYITTITWFKSNTKNPGYWFRGYTEFLLFGVKGKVKSFRSQIKNIQKHPVTHHSEKPGLFRKLIEKASPELYPRLELFARINFDGWDVWGNEAPKLINLTLDSSRIAVGNEVKS